MYGIDSLSMRKLGGLLGVKAMSLYNHMPNKDSIINCLIDKVISEIALPDVKGNWKNEMKKRAVSAHNTLLKHAWATIPLVSRIVYTTSFVLNLNLAVIITAKQAADNPPPIVM